MQRYFDEELVNLKNNLQEMGLQVDRAIMNSVKALKTLNKDQAQEVIAQDRDIDNKELEIDEFCLELLARWQPMAVDLRSITMTMKISTDLERMADLAVDIAQRTLELVDKPLLKPLVDIPKLAVLAQEMTHQALESFINNNVNLAREVILRDNEADNLRNLVQSELLNDYIAKDVSTIPRAIPLFLVARHLERICDHATNIAEDVIFMIQAKVVKHHPEKLD
jgi:phosphate transport system protein